MILIVQSQWNLSITQPMRLAAEERIRTAGIDFKSLQVPGALEIPLAIKWAWEAHQRTNTALLGAVALGCVIKGETLHFELVATDCSRALTQLSLELSLPIGHGVLAVYEVEQAAARSQGSENKGLEAAEAVLKMIDLREQLKRKESFL